MSRGVIDVVIEIPKEKKTGIEGWEDRAAAERVVEEAARRYRDTGGR